jgi:hypothetical protein
MKEPDMETYTVEITNENFMGTSTEIVTGLRSGEDVQAVKDGAKFTAGMGDTLTFRVTADER